MTEREFSRNERNTVKRVARRGRYDRATIYHIIDQSFMVHVGIGEPLPGPPNIGPTIIPMFHARIGDDLIFHGATTSRLMNYLCSGKPVCVSATLVDGIVLARSLFHHSMNYRSVVAFGTGRQITDETARLDALRAMTNKLIPGRWDDARKPNRQELKATTIAAVRIESASAKIRTGGPIDDSEDMELPIWAGVLPILTQYGVPQADLALSNAIDIPHYLTSLSVNA